MSGNCGSESWTYDPAGNRLTQEMDGDLTTYAYDPANRLRYAETGTGRTTYTFDADGNQRTIEAPGGDVTTHIWSYENQQIAVEQPTGDRITYTYAPVNRNSVELRVERETADGITVFLWDDQNVIQELDDLGALGAEYTLAPQPFGNLVSQHRDTESSFYQFDALGSTRALTDDSQTVTDSAFYHAFGQAFAPTGTTENPFGWVGELGYYLDAETGQQSLRQRQYETGIGRFASQDPLTADPNFYRYAANNPINFVDPEGLESREIIQTRGTKDGKPGTWYQERWVSRHLLSCIPCWTPYKQTVRWGDMWFVPDDDPTDPLGYAINRQKTLLTPIANCAGEVYGNTEEGLCATVVIGSILLPGPDDLVWGVVFSKYGIKLIGNKLFRKKPGTGQLEELAGKQLDEAAELVQKEKQQMGGRCAPEVSPAPPKCPPPKILQTGGQTLTPATARELNKATGRSLHQREWGRALERLKDDFGLPRTHHGKIDGCGNYLDMDGNVFGALEDYLF